MNRPKLPFIRLTAAGGLALAALLLAAPRPARAQATVSVDAGLSQNYRTEGWVPVRVTLTNQGAPARVEVRARFSSMGPVQEYRIPERELPNGANTLHTLYMKSPRAYGNQPLLVELYKDGRVINTVRPNMRPLSAHSWFIYGIGPDASTAPLNILSSGTFPPRLPGTLVAGTPANRRGAPMAVSTSAPAAAPDRWQGLSSVDLVVLSGVSERDFRPEQLSALREYAAAGGTLVVTGGLNWNRLTTGFFQEVLPVRVTGSASASSLPAPEGSFSGRSFPILTSQPKSGAEVTLGDSSRPLVVQGHYGSGRVVFMAFDPSLPPLRDWSGLRQLWAGLVQTRPAPSLLQVVAQQDEGYEMYGGAMPPGYYGSSEGRLADAPFAIPQLDIPAFYVVALFLLAYVIILVPVNYFFLKARDKKEYAWLTTPAIVVLFSVGAYAIGYGFKGGNTLAVQVGLVETSANQGAAPFVFYSGLFSPRKTGYDVRFASAGTQQDPFSNALFTEPGGEPARAGLRLVQDDQPRIQDFSVDMWAMRVLKAVGVADLGKGIQAQVQVSGSALEGQLTNATPFHLEGCAVVAGAQSYPVGDLAPGATLKLQPGKFAENGSAGTLLPSSLLDTVQGRSQKARMRRAILDSLTLGRYNTPSFTTGGFRLVGWIRDPVGRLQVDGKTPREVAETLVVVRLN